MKATILIVVEQNGNLADETLRLLKAQGLGVQLARHLREACHLLSQHLDIVLLTASVAAAAVRSALFTENQDTLRVLVVAGEEGSKEAMLELLEAGAFSFMHTPRSASSILKEMHRIRKLLKVRAQDALYPLRKAS